MNLSLIANVLIICLGLLEAVSSTPELYRASDGNHYLIETEQTHNNFQAGNRCNREGYQLAAIDSEEKNAALIELLMKVTGGKPVNVWLDGNDEFNLNKDYNRDFYLLTSGQKLNFTNWADDNPNNYRRREHCVHIWSKSSYKWNDNRCEEPMGFVCEGNRYKQIYDKDLKHKCDAVKKISSSISNELRKAHEQQRSEIDGKIQNIESVLDDWRAQIKSQQTTTLTTINKILADKQQTVKEWTEDMLQRVNQLNVEIKSATADISAKFGEKLSGKRDEINKIC